MKLDSIAEGGIAARMLELGFIRYNEFFMLAGAKRRFCDKQSKAFGAKPDWYNPKLNVFAESKFHPLNAKTSQASADAGMTRQLVYRQGRGEAGNEDLARYDKLNNQWNHSQVKQAIVQQDLTPYKFIVFFKQPPTFEEMHAYTAKGLFPIALDSMPAYLLNLRLQPAGGTSYQASYTDHETGERVVFSLGLYRANDSRDTNVCEFIPGEKARWLQAN
jgi:hypothetical protein